MPKVKNALAAFLCFTLLLPPVHLSSIEHGEPSNPQIISSTTAAVTPTSSILPSVTTCESRTANYITHTLPQQCLRANWTRSINTTTASGESPVQIDLSSSGAQVANVTRLSSSEGAEPLETLNSSLASDLDTQNANSNTLMSAESTLAQEISNSDAASPSATASSEIETETDSPLDNSKFLSFEEWKKQNLARIGQSPENVGQGRASGADGRKRPSPITNDLDALGDDGEIDLGFGFGPGKADDSAPGWSSSQSHESAQATDQASEEDAAASGSMASRKDAGTTGKERFNYASFDCAATVLKTNPQCKSSSSVLVENKDSYMLNECAADNKFLIVELCDDILIDTIVLANFEFFSSMLRTFRVSIADRYPVKADRWKELGIFEARNSREIQAFPILNPLIWTRYVRIEFLTHYGNEYYCPVSLLRVHGTTMMEEFRSQDESGRTDDDVEDELRRENHVSDDSMVTSSLTETLSVKEQEQKVRNVEESESAELQYEQGIPTIAANLSDIVSSTSEIGSSTSTTPEPSSVLSTSNITADSQTPEASSENSTGSDSIGSESSQSLINVGKFNDTESAASEATPTSIVEPSESLVINSTLNSTTATADEPPVHNITLSNNTVLSDSGASSKTSQTTPESSRSATSAQAPAASPTTQESFFKSIHKRLQMLEANSTLSLQYIEEQSRILRDAFAAVDKRQAGKAEAFLRSLDDTVMAELRGFRAQYDQLWQSTVIELETHRDRHARELAALSARLSLMADELLFQKRLAVVQATLLLLCVGLALFVRAGAAGAASSSAALELPLLQQLAGLAAGRLPFDSPSPPASPSSRDASPLRTRRSLGASPTAARTPPARLNPRIAVAPATPDDDDDAAADDGDADSDSPLEHAARSSSSTDAGRLARSGPATPSGTRESLRAPEWSGSEGTGTGTGSSSPARGP